MRVRTAEHGVTPQRNGGDEAVRRRNRHSCPTQTRVESGRSGEILRQFGLEMPQGHLGAEECQLLLRFCALQRFLQDGAADDGAVVFRQFANEGDRSRTVAEKIHPDGGVHENAFSGGCV